MYIYIYWCDLEAVLNSVCFQLSCANILDAGEKTLTKYSLSCIILFMQVIVHNCTYTCKFSYLLYNMLILKEINFNSQY